MDNRKLNKLRLEFLKKWYILQETFAIENDMPEELEKAEKELNLEYLGLMGFFK